MRFRPWLSLAEKIALWQGSARDFPIPGRDDFVPGRHPALERLIPGRGPARDAIFSARLSHGGNRIESVQV